MLAKFITEKTWGNDKDHTVPIFGTIEDISKILQGLTHIKI